ncbi:MAG TPA: carboxypeptidase-like regulatory domain-containing protein, partial [Terracidiphilus sp.]|nr:carboxypeptidase-like regulatory domain-containing protein [Terracidiphilus sp.]
MAQTIYGSIVGSVTDSTGALVGGATIQVTQIETGATRTVSSNSVGVYSISTLDAGTYRVIVTKAGFGEFAAKNVAVRINTIVRVDAALSVSSVSQSVQVSAQTAQLQTDSADVHGEITSNALQNLPQPTRTYEGLIGLMPGVSPPSASSGGTNNPARSMALESNGTSQSATNVRIEGVGSTNPWVQYFSTAVPSVEALETVNVVTASADADEGLGSGAAINVQIKSGTNHLHGSFYEYHEDNALKARPYFEPVDQRLPKLIDNDFGGTLGGPIFKDKLFFFGSYEGDFTRMGSSNIVTVPTDDIRNGIMTASPTPIYDPSTGNPDGTGRTPFADNTLPSIDPIAAKIVALIPEPNLPGLANNYFVNTPIVSDLHKVDTKFDWHTTQNLTFTGRVSDYPYIDNQKTIFGDVLAGGHEYTQNGNIYAISISGTYVARPNLVLSGTFGVTHSTQNYAPPGTNVRYGSDVLGIPGTNLGDLPAGGSMPNFNINGYEFYGYDYPALIYNDPIFQYTGTGTWTKGRHTINFGIDISQQHMNHMEVQP